MARRSRNKEYTGNHFKEFEAKTEQQGHYWIACHGKHLITASGPSGCVDGDTEVLTDIGWVKISNWIESSASELMQYDPYSRKASLIEPLDYIKKPSDGFYSIKTDRGLDMLLSKEHRILYETSKGNLNFKTAEDFVKQHEGTKRGSYSKFLTTYDFDGGFKIPLTDDEIRLFVAIKADSTLATESTNRYVFRLKKERKINRLEYLLKKTNKQYKKKYEEKSGYTVISLYEDRCSKQLSEWMFCSQPDAKVITEELRYWDGVYAPSGVRLSNFSTVVKEDADAVQYFYNILGVRASISTQDRRGQSYKNGYIRKSIEYLVRPTTQTKLTLAGDKRRDIPFIGSGIFKYCFSVPTSAFVARRGDNVFITGNCGKSFVAVAYAATMLREREIERIVITRPAVENDNETYGYLKGDLEEKIQPYIAPIRSIFEDILGKSETEAYLHSKKIEVIPLGFMRGRTLDNCIIICDEAQNTTPKQMKTLLTRIGQYSKAIIQGDFKQKDIDSKSGLEVIIDYFDSAPYYQHIEFEKEDIVRSDLIGDILGRFEKYEAE